MNVPDSLSKRPVQVMLGLLVLALGYQPYVRMRLRMSGASRAALEQLAACEEARKLLGEPFDARTWSWSHGSLRVPRRSQVWSAASGGVDWSMPVAGPSGRGVLHFQGEKVLGRWKLEGLLTIGGTPMVTLGCQVP